jgi:hypothetical protein
MFSTLEPSSTPIISDSNILYTNFKNKSDLPILEKDYRFNFHVESHWQICELHRTNPILNLLLFLHVIGKSIQVMLFILIFCNRYLMRLRYLALEVALHNIKLKGGCLLAPTVYV